MPQTPEMNFNQLRDDLQRALRKNKELEDQLKNALVGIVPDPEIYDSSFLFVTPGVEKDGNAFVTVRLGTSIIQLDAINGITVGLDLIAQCEAAHADSVLFRFFRDEMGLEGTSKELGNMLDSFRAKREQEALDRKKAFYAEQG